MHLSFSCILQWIILHTQYLSTWFKFTVYIYGQNSFQINMVYVLSLENLRISSLEINKEIKLQSLHIKN